MVVRPRVLAAVALAGIAASAFFVGRRVEEAAVAAKMSSSVVQAPSASATPVSQGPSYQQLRAADVLALPFTDFYEALRSAPGEARKQWAVELEQMPAGPHRTAAVIGFYKLLIQFDPTLAIKTIREIKENGIRNLALEAAVDTVPGFAMEELALAMTQLYEHPTGHTRDYFDELMEQWMNVDPAAVIRFGEQHKDPRVPYGDSPETISTWAEIDPKAAKEWLDAHDHWKTAEYRRAFISGLYESDRPAAISYVLTHASEPDERDSLGNILRGLYYDSKDEARKFIEALPNDRIRHAAFRAAFENRMYDEVEDGGDPNSSPRATADWMIEFPSAYWKGRLKDVFRWSGKPPQEMISWIEGQPPSIRDLVAAEYTPPFGSSAVDAFNAILKVADPRLRDQLLKATLPRSGEGIDDLHDAIANAPLSVEQRAHILQLRAEVDARPREDQEEPLADYGSEK
jgi:hypothetical protein